MTCLTCQHSICQTFANGEMTTDVLFCKLLMRDVKGGLVKCGGYQEKKVEYVNYTPYVPPKVFEQPCQESAVDCKEPEQEEPKPITQSERMKEYWRNRKKAK